MESATVNGNRVLMLMLRIRPPRQIYVIPSSRTNSLILQPDNPGTRSTMPFTLLSEDELIARLLIHTWTLTTGKTLRCDVPPHELSEEELIDFWSDDRFD